MRKQLLERPHLQPLIEKVSRVAASNPRQFDAAKLYVANGLTLPQATHLLRISYVAAALKQSRFNQNRVAREHGLHRNTVSRIVSRI